MLPPHILFRNFARRTAVALNVAIYRRFWGMDIGEGVLISLKSILDKTNPKRHPYRSIYRHLVQCGDPEPRLY